MHKITPLLAEQVKNEQLQAEKTWWKALALLLLFIACALGLSLIGAVYMVG